MNAERSILRDATIALHEELARLEQDIAELPDGKTHSRVIETFSKLWQKQHDKLAQFYDLDVYLDREAPDELFEPPHCVGHSTFPVPA